MQHTEEQTCKPNSRARVSARRKSRQTRRVGPVATPTSATPPVRSRHVRERLRQSSATPRSSRRTTTTARWHGQASLNAAADVLRNRRESMQAWLRQREKERERRARKSQPQVRPGPRPLLMHWLMSGRLFSLLLFLATIGTLVYVFNSPQFSIQEIEVSGNSVLQSDLITDLSGLHGESIWFVNTSLAGERLLQNAYVEQASIGVLLPNQATVQVSERQPDVRWRVGEVEYLLDATGTVLDIASEPAPAGTLVIYGSGQGSLAPSDHVDPDALELARALALRLPVELDFTPARIGWDIGLGVYVDSDSGQRIVFGTTENLDRKLTVFHYLLTDGTAFTYLDLRTSSPYYRVDG